jgi:hypothetical protein
MKKRGLDEKQTTLDNFQSRLFEVIKRILELLSLDDRSNYGKMITASIQQKAVEIEMKIDEFLEEMKIPFRTEEFLLLLFHELYENFMFSKGNFINKV